MAFYAIFIIGIVCIMFEQFDIKNGILSSLKAALKDDSFIVAVFDMLLGREGAAQEVEFALKRASQEQTLNEVVAVHRLYKQRVNEGIFNKDTDKEGLMTQLKNVRKKSNKFMRKVLVRTLKEKGMVASLIYIIKALATPGYPIDDLLAAPQAARFVVCLVKNAVELAGEEREMQPSLAESVVSQKLRRIFKHASHKKSTLSEGIDDKYGGRIPVNVYTGRFQPFHLGHLSNLEEAAKRGVRTVICPVMKGTSAKAKDHPFEAVEGEMFEKIKNAYGDLVADIVPIKNPFIEFWVLPLRERGFEPIMWTTGSDRQPSYQAMVDKYKDKYELVDGFEVVGLDKDMDAEGGSANDTGKISGTAIRKCLVDGNEEGFRQQMPKCLWDMYEPMREIMLQYAMPAQQANLTEEELMQKRIDEAFRKLLNEK